MFTGDKSTELLVCEFVQDILRVDVSFLDML